VGNLDDRSLSRIAPDTYEHKSTRLDATPDAVAAGGAWAWVMNGRLGTLYRIDAGSALMSGQTRPLWQKARKSTGAGVDAAGGFVWAAFGDKTLARVNPATLVGDAAPSTATGPTALVFAYGFIWVATATNQVQKFSPDTWDLGPLREWTVCRSPSGIAAGDGAIWVACRDDDLVQRIAVDLTSESSRSIAVGHGPAAIAFGDGAVWVANKDDGTVSRIDAETYEVVKTIELGNAPAGIAFSHGRVWVSVQAPFTS
jgi:YVTN family beta-propeller protein